MVVYLNMTDDNALELDLDFVEIKEFKYNVHLGGDKSNLMKSIANVLNRFKPIIE